MLTFFLTQRNAELSAEECKEIRVERVEFDAQFFCIKISFHKTGVSPVIYPQVSDRTCRYKRKYHAE
jgi:hypothetical protein